MSVMQYRIDSLFIILSSTVWIIFVLYVSLLLVFVELQLNGLAGATMEDTSIIIISWWYNLMLSVCMSYLYLY